SDSYIFLDSFTPGKYTPNNTYSEKLVISAHGGVGRIKINSVIHNSATLSNFLLNSIQSLNTYKYIVLACCMSAFGDRSSLACQLSTLLPGTYVKGYKGGIYTLCQPDQVLLKIEQEGMDAASIMLTHALLKEHFVDKEDREFH